MLHMAYVLINVLGVGICPAIQPCWALGCDVAFVPFGAITWTFAVYVI